MNLESNTIGVLVSFSSLVATIIIGWIAIWISQKTFSYSQKKQDFEYLSYAIENFASISEWRRIKRQLFFRTISYFKGLDDKQIILLISILKNDKNSDLVKLNIITRGIKEKLIKLLYKNNSTVIEPMYKDKFSYLLFRKSSSYKIFSWLLFLVWLFFILCISIEINLISKSIITFYLLCLPFVWIPEYYLLRSIDKREQIDKLEVY
jgi:hypothetical protein